MICLSGNPYGAAVNLELMARPVLAKMSGRYDLQITRLNAVIDHDYFKKCPVVRYVRAFYRDGMSVRRMAPMRLVSSAI